MHQSHLLPSSASPVSLSPGSSQRTSPVGSNLISLTISRTNAYLKRKNAMLHSSLSGAPCLDFFFPFYFAAPPCPHICFAARWGRPDRKWRFSAACDGGRESRAHKSPSPLALHAIPALLHHQPSLSPLLSSPLPPPSHLSSSGVTKGARCLVPENVPTYQKAPGLHVEAAQRRKRSR